MLRDRHLALEVVKQASNSEGVVDFKLRLLFPEGRVKYIRVLVRPLGIANDDLEFAGAVIDRTEAHLAEERIRQDEAELRLLIDAIPQQVAVFSSDWNPLFANRQAQEYTGLSLQEFQSIAAIDRLIHPDDLGRLHGNRERATRESAPVETEARIRGKEGIYRWFCCAPIRFKTRKDASCDGTPHEPTSRSSRVLSKRGKGCDNLRRIWHTPIE
jgi:PAS domain S-box-containing protein